MTNHQDNGRHDNDPHNNCNDQDDSCWLLGRERQTVVSTNWELFRKQFGPCSSGPGDDDDDLDDNVDDDPDGDDDDEQ